MQVTKSDLQKGMSKMAKVTPGKVEENYERFMVAWENLTPTKSFGGMTLDQFKATVLPSVDARKSVRDAQVVLEGAIENRDNVDQATIKAMDAIKKSVIADPTVGGDDGALYEALGFIPKSKHKTGNTRKNSKKEVPTP